MRTNEKVVRSHWVTMNTPSKAFPKKPMYRSLGQKLLMVLNALLAREIQMECDHIPFHFQDLPVKKVLNWILVEISYTLKLERMLGLPTHLQVEPTNLCDLRCALCYVTRGLNRPQGQMEFNTLKKLIDEIGDYLFLILFWGWGEPFLNPSAYEMISYAKQKNIKVLSSTHGHAFADGNHAEKVVRSGLDSLIFAVDGISQETYELYRKGGDLRKVIKGIRRVVEAKRSLNSKTPLINLRFIPMKHNEHEIPRLRDFAQTLQVDLLTLKTLNLHDNGEPIETKAEKEEYIPENPVYQRLRFDPVDYSPIRRKEILCKDLWNLVFLQWDGRIVTCCHDYSGMLGLGDISRQTLRDIWFGRKYRTLRRRWLENYRLIPQCAECSSGFEGGDLGTELIADSHFFPSSSG